MKLATFLSVYLIGMMALVWWSQSMIYKGGDVLWVFR